MTEIWLPIEGYENLYEVSNLGRVRRLASVVTSKAGVTRKFSGKILKPVTHRDGYLRVNLCKNGKIKTFRVHRLVASAFIPNPKGLPAVNHKDECKTNNAVSNLEWCTTEYNNNYGTHNERNIKLRKIIRCVELDKTFPSILAASKELNLQSGNISHVLTGRRKSAGGYHFEFAEIKAAS